MEISSDSEIQQEAQLRDSDPETLLIPPPSFVGQVNPALLERIKNRLDSQSLESQTLVSSRLGLTLPLLAEPEVQRQLTQTLLGPNRDAAFGALSMLRISCAPETKNSLIEYVRESSNPRSLRIRCVLALKACSEDPFVSQVLVDLSRDPLVASLRQAAASALIPIHGAPTDAATSRLEEMVSCDLDATTRWQATRELFLGENKISPDKMAQILEGPCELGTFLLGLPLHTNEWSPAFMQRILELYGSAPGAKPWVTEIACEAALRHQRDTFPGGTATSLITAIVSLQESNTLSTKVAHKALDLLLSICKHPHPDWGPLEKAATLKLFNFLKDRLKDEREIFLRGEKPDNVLLTDASLILTLLVRNNLLPEQAHNRGFSALCAGIPEEIQINLKREHLANEAIHNTAGYGALFSFLSSLPGQPKIASTFLDRVLKETPSGCFSSSLREAFSYITQQQSSWSLADYYQIRVLDLMHALHIYNGPDADDVRTCIEERYLRLASEQLPIQLYHALCAPLSEPKAACSWETFPVLSLDPRNTTALPTTVSPFSAQQILQASQELNTYIQRQVADMPLRLGFTSGGFFTPIEEGPPTTYAKRFASAQEVVTRATEQTHNLLSEMISLSPLMNDLPKEAFLLPPANFSERLIQAGIRPELHDRLLGLASQIQALQAEVNTSLNSCLSHLRKRIASYNKLLENQDARVSSLESRLAKSRTDLLTLYAAASLVDRIRITSSPRVLFSQMLADFGEATAPLVTFFSSHWRGDPDVARAAVDCTGQFLLGDGSEPVERSTEVTDWLTASTALGYQIPQHLEPLAYVTVCTRMSNAMPVDLLHIDFKPILALQELESLWLSNPSGREQEEVQTLLRYAAIQLRFPGFARYLGSLDFQRNLVGIVNSNVSNDLREVAVFALSHYGSEEYSGVQLKPASIQALIKAASTKEDPITQIYNIRAIPDAYIEDLIKKLSAGGRAGSSAIKQLSPLVSLLEKSDSRDVRLEITKKLFPALLQNSSKHDFIREPILRALGRVSDRRYLAEQMEDLLLAIDSMFEWTKSPENVAASLTTDNKLSPETLNCYALLDFLFTHESSSDKAVARGASFLLKHIFG